MQLIVQVGDGEMDFAIGAVRRRRNLSLIHISYMVMRAMGELLLTRHDYRSFADFVGEYLGPQASFYLGWTYWLSWVVTCIADVVVCGSYKMCIRDRW